MGSLFYLRYQKDFEMGSAQEMFHERKFRALCKQNSFDPVKVEFLEKYISDLKEQIGVLKNEADKYTEETLTTERPATEARK